MIQWEPAESWEGNWHPWTKLHPNREGRGTKCGAEEEEKEDAEGKEQQLLLNGARPREREMLTDICMQHRPQPVPEKYFIVPEERIYSGT